MIHVVFTATTPRPASIKEFVGYLLGRYVSYAVLPDFSGTAGLAFLVFLLFTDADLEKPLTIRDVYTLSVC
jgi:hypothetical protein